jgi:hypothetical protein
VVAASYDLQCNRQDAKQLITLLSDTYGNDSSQFVFYKMRHDNPTMFLQSIQKQQQYMANKRVIPIQGISPDIMSTLQFDLLAIDGISDVLEHKLTHVSGRWSLMTTKESFFLAKSLVKSVLSTLTHFDDEDLHLPPCGLAFKNQTNSPHSKQKSPKILPSTKPTQHFNFPPTKSDTPNPYSNPKPSSKSVSSFRPKPPPPTKYSRNLPSCPLSHDFKVSHWQTTYQSSIQFRPSTKQPPSNTTSTSSSHPNAVVTASDINAISLENTYLRRQLAQLSIQVQQLSKQLSQISRPS